jgi:DNA-binding HxlR family transcriptional regulator
MAPKQQSNRGMGNSQQEKRYNTQLTILEALFDGELHQNMELKTKTKLSSNSLTKSLKEMVKIKVIEKKEDVKNGKYAVLYKITQDPLIYMMAINIWKNCRKQINEMLKQHEDPLFILKKIQDANQLLFAQILEQIKINKEANEINPEEIKFLEEVLLFQNYRNLTRELITATTKIINKINIDGLFDSQYKRHKSTHTFIQELQKIAEQDQKYNGKPKPKQDLKEFKNIKKKTQKQPEYFI